MAKMYTYDDFKKALAQSGLGGEFSDSDLRLAERNPDAGMSLLSYKQDYNNAATDELRALAHAGAESVRSSFGDYSGGEDGSKFNAINRSPASFNFDKKAPEYKSSYTDQINGLMGEIMNPKPFDYNVAKDPLYSSYKKTYTREGQRATEDVLGDAAAMTGGIPSSYAVSAAAQAGNQYAAALADKVPELYDMAYQKYLTEYNQKLDRLQELEGRENFEYSQYLDEVKQYESDRDFNYSQWLDDIESKANERSEALKNAYAAAEFGDFSQLESLGIRPDYDYLASLNVDSKNGTKLGGTTAVIDEETLGILKQAYPDGVITSEGEWSYLVSKYGESALTAAGYTKGEAVRGDTSGDMKQLVGIDQTEGTMITNDVYDLVQLMQSGDADIKTVEDIKNVIYSLYPEYKGNALFEDYINRVISGSRNPLKK